MSTSPRDICALLAKLRSRAPLVHCLTNQVVTNFTANVLLALGAVPAMVVAPEEVSQFAAVADALSVNIGTLTQGQKESIRRAVKSSRRAGKPWVLDPVAVGTALPFRTEFAAELVRDGRPTAIRANASEVIELDEILRSDEDEIGGDIKGKGNNAGGGGRGPDSGAESSAALAHAKDLAHRAGTLVAMTGRRDFVFDPNTDTVIGVDYGHPLMTKVTGIGCALSASLAAFLAVAESSEERRIACVAALTISGIAGERAADVSKGPGTFAVAYLDNLANLQETDLLQKNPLRILNWQSIDSIKQ